MTTVSEIAGALLETVKPLLVTSSIALVFYAYSAIREGRARVWEAVAFVACMATLIFGIFLTGLLIVGAECLLGCR